MHGYSGIIHSIAHTKMSHSMSHTCIICAASHICIPHSRTHMRHSISHTRTRCTLQHIAIHCNTSQHIATTTSTDSTLPSNNPKIQWENWMQMRDLCGVTDSDCYSAAPLESQHSHFWLKTKDLGVGSVVGRWLMFVACCWYAELLFAPAQFILRSAFSTRIGLVCGGK